MPGVMLGLGTAQFGLEYGVSNVIGKPSLAEVGRILEIAHRVRVRVIDTAPVYGDSEDVLGQCLAGDRAFRIVTKTLPLRTSRVSAEAVRRVVDGFRASLTRLRRDRVYALLVHHADDLLVEDGARLMDALAEFKAQGLVERIGVSVYAQREIEAIISRYGIDIVQAPLSVLDQRLLGSGTLAALKRRGIEVHVRSVFLQGLLLMDPDALAEHFQPARATLHRFRTYAQAQGRTALEAALEFIASRDEVDCAVIGVARHEELEEIAAALRLAPRPGRELASFALHDESILDPARWPQ